MDTAVGLQRDLLVFCGAFCNLDILASSFKSSSSLPYYYFKGGPLDHCTNAPLRGGKHTFFEGGVRVTSFMSGPVVPAHRRGTEWHGMAASADWYKTLVEGVAGGKVPEDTGPRPPDSVNLWPAIANNGKGKGKGKGEGKGSDNNDGDDDDDDDDDDDADASPRWEVVHQVHNQYCCDKTHGDSCSASIRIHDMKLIQGNPGDSRTVAWPELSDAAGAAGTAGGAIPFGLTGGKVEPGTDHARAPGVSGSVFELACDPFCLFNLTADLGERHDLAQDPAYKEIAANLTERLAYHAATGPPPAYLWPDADDWKTKGVEPLCAASETSGHVEPLDVSAESRS